MATAYSRHTYALAPSLDDRDGAGNAAPADQLRSVSCPCWKAMRRSSLRVDRQTGRARTETITANCRRVHHRLSTVPSIF